MRRHAGIIVIAVLLAAQAALAWAEVLAPRLPAGLELDGSATVASAIDGDSLTLADGRTVRLVGIQAPKLPKGRPNFPEWPLARAAQEALQELAAGRAVTLAVGGAPQDRYGRILAHLARADDGLWLQGEMLKRGLARVYTFPDNRAAAPAMYALESEARAARRGIWADPFYKILAPDEALQHVDELEIVEGRVVEAVRVSSGVYLNFGTDWHTAFTLHLRGEALKLFRAARIDPLALKGESLRVRGYIRRDRGRAVIDITHPEEIEKF